MVVIQRRSSPEEYAELYKKLNPGQLKLATLLMTGDITRTGSPRRHMEGKTTLFTPTSTNFNLISYYTYFKTLSDGRTLEVRFNKGTSDLLLTMSRDLDGYALNFNFTVYIQPSKKNSTGIYYESLGPERIFLKEVRGKKTREISRKEISIMGKREIVFEIPPLHNKDAKSSETYTTYQLAYDGTCARWTSNVRVKRFPMDSYKDLTPKEAEILKSACRGLLTEVTNVVSGKENSINATFGLRYRNLLNFLRVAKRILTMPLCKVSDLILQYN